MVIDERPFAITETSLDCPSARRAKNESWHFLSAGPNRAAPLLVVEADQQGATDEYSGGTQVAGGAQEQRFELFIRDVTSLHIHANRALALGCQNVVRLASQGQCLFGSEPGLPGIDLLLRRDLVMRKKLLRAGTGLSARSVVTPVNSLHVRFLRAVSMV